MSNQTLTDEQRCDIVKYRMENARKMLAEVESHRENGFYNTAVNRMYYACYYAATAMLISLGVEVKSHDGVRLNLGKYVVMKGRLLPELGRFYSRLFSKRSTGDYDDFINHTLETVDDLLPQAKEFIDTLLSQLNDWLSSQKSSHNP